MKRITFVVHASTTIPHIKTHVLPQLSRARCISQAECISNQHNRRTLPRLDWFHINRRLERIGKDLLYLPAGKMDFGTQRSIHARNLESVKWMLWHDGVEMAEHGMTLFRIGLFQHAQECDPGNLSGFAGIETKLNELRSYLYANRESVLGYARVYRNQERVSTAHVKSTVNQLINWRFCKKQQASWTRAGAQALLHVKTAVINGRLERYTGHREREAAPA